MSVNAEVKRNDNENDISLIRRFSKRVQGAGLLPTLRARRYFARPKSAAVARKGALKRLARREKVQELIKLGVMTEAPRRGRGRR
jgi:ribosomal protein S21